MAWRLINGSVGQAFTTVARSGSAAIESVEIAPDSAALVAASARNPQLVRFLHRPLVRIQLNLLIALLIAAPAVLVLPFVTLVLGTFVTWSDYLAATAMNVFWTTLAIAGTAAFLHWVCSCYAFYGVALIGSWPSMRLDTRAKLLNSPIMFSWLESSHVATVGIFEGLLFTG
jgi:hypothetical protein